VESSDRSSPTCPDELSLAPAAYGPPGAPMSDKAPRLQTNLRKSVSPAVVDTAVTSSRSFMSIGQLIDVPPGASFRGMLERSVPNASASASLAMMRHGTMTI